MTGYPNANSLGTALAAVPEWLIVAAERFAAKWELDEQTGCHLWNGHKSAGGYGRFPAGGVEFSAHRFAYELHHKAPLRSDVVLDHLCRVRHCVNPMHVEPVAQVENIRRGDSGLNNAVKTHCPHGHEYTPENTYVIPASGSRTCRTCARRRRRECGARSRRAA